jgi:asparagine synthetase B (glutamine-hydrolysing)
VTMARNHGASVILTGAGGDELGSVMGFVRDLIRDHQWLRALSEFAFFPGATAKTRIERLKQFARQSAPSALSRWNARLKARAPMWLAPRLAHFAKDLVAPELSRTSYPSRLAWHVWNRLTSPVLSRVVTQLQEHAALYGLEYRFPFLDRELVTFVMTTSYKHWPRPGAFARLHRAPLGDLLPPEVRQRFGKAEFTPALATRIRNARPHIQAILDDGPWCSGQYVERQAARRFCRTVLAKDADPSSRDWIRLWSIATLEAWMRKIFGYHPCPVEA